MTAFLEKTLHRAQGGMYEDVHCSTVYNFRIPKNESLLWYSGKINFYIFNTGKYCTALEMSEL